MATMLCASCQHSFPEDMLAPASFSTRVGRYLSRSTSLLCATRGKTSKDDHRLSQLAQLLQQLCGAVQEEAQLLQERQNDLPVATFSSSSGRTGQPQQQQQQQQQPRSRGGAPHSVSFASHSDRCRGTPSAELCGTLDGTGRLPYVGTSSFSFSVAPVNSPRIMFEGSVPSYQLKRMVTAFDLVSATLYNMLESLAVQCRANVALLWLRPRQNLSSSELVAPFVVGCDLSSLANSAPYCTVEFSIPCVVCQTGVALNLKPQPHLPSTATSSGSDSMLTELMEHTNAAQLLVPVHDRYKERSVAARASTVNASSAIAVIHLIGSPINPVPFHRHNEEAVAQTSTLLSFIISSYYETMIAEWSNRFYVPTTLHATGKYAAGLDLRAEDKVIDDFATAPLLMLRTTVSNLSGHTSANDARDALKLLSQNAQRRSAPLRPMATVKDLFQHATEMETNWASAVEQITRLEHTVAALKEDLLRRDISNLQKAQDAHTTRGTSAGTHSRLTADKKCAVQPPSVAVAAPVAEKRSSLSIAGINIPLTPPVPYASETATMAAAAFSSAAEPVPPSTEVLKADEVDLLEAVTLRRLRELGVDTSRFE
ncbi:conserved hypothetical protein [Leishmania major strain Friedlin]|uniref:Uncharacterized protein n=1 Tax=Leishmania major TaxID=5664 RepID=Q4Q0A3_LEIMA|nr:conserved hypothetical protein [Leishmania major strain Friedlin]CAG9584216.1 hypothetical_protein_-_conserved [Leishmania major strain Friedlin]CAJ09632.1 conserved hypothetical protein [Leishmania major strain Friedlin]|eukprot:XP_001687245.1 conserved hypothetical protein [Leishmania major strain Friedlin]